jgi:Flp pilus assembly protein TadG
MDGTSVLRCLSRAWRAVRRLVGATEGGVLTMVALVTPVLLGTAGLGIETGLWYLQKRAAQTAADAAAYSGALQRIRGPVRPCSRPRSRMPDETASSAAAT